MKDEDTSDDVPTPTMSAHQHENGSDGPPLPSPSTVPQDAPAEAGLSRMERRPTLRHHVRLVLVVLVVALAGGYSLFRVGVQPSRQTSAAFQAAHCPFPL